VELNNNNNNKTVGIRIVKTKIVGDETVGTRIVELNNNNNNKV